MRSVRFVCSIRPGSFLMSCNLSLSTRQSAQLPLSSPYCLFSASLQLSIVSLSSRLILASYFYRLEIYARHSFLYSCGFPFGCNERPLSGATVLVSAGAFRQVPIYTLKSAAGTNNCQYDHRGSTNSYHLSLSLQC